MTVGELISLVCADIRDKQLDWDSDVVAKLFDWNLKDWKDVAFSNPGPKGDQLWLLCLDDETKDNPDHILEVIRELNKKSGWYWTEYKGLDGASHPEMRGSDYVQGLADGLYEALEVVEAVFGHVDMERRRG